MSTFTLRILDDALARETEQLEGSIERAVLAGLDEAARRTAASARASHGYRNRTGDLERSTTAQDADGDVWADRASSAAVAWMDYASFVDARLPILGPAWETVRDGVEATFEQLLEQACRG